MEEPPWPKGQDPSGTCQKGAKKVTKKVVFSGFLGFWAKVSRLSEESDF